MIMIRSYLHVRIHYDGKCKVTVMKMWTCAWAKNRNSDGKPVIKTHYFFLSPILLHINACMCPICFDFALILVEIEI